jgi:hypothetical protein
MLSVMSDERTRTKLYAETPLSVPPQLKPTIATRITR